MVYSKTKDRCKSRAKVRFTEALPTCFRMISWIADRKLTKENSSPSLKTPFPYTFLLICKGLKNK